MTITRDDVDRLVNSPEPTAALVLVHGSAEVVRRSRLDHERYRGAFIIAEREDILDGRHPDQLSDEDIDAIARRVETVVGQLGG